MKSKHLTIIIYLYQNSNVIFQHEIQMYSYCMNSKEIFGQNLRHYRKLNNLTQEELSEKLGITAIHLGRIENGKSFVTAELLDSLCVILKVSPSSLFYTSQEFSGDDSLFTKIDSIIDNELNNFVKIIKEKIRY